MSEIEKQFFETFGIEPKYKGYSNTEELSTGGVIPCGNIKYFNTIEEMDKANYWCFNMWELNEEDKDYPQITDRILLKLLSIQSYEKSYYTLSPFDNIDELKEDLLNEFIDGYTYDLYNDREDVKHQVQALFKENN